ncbi:VOC family protein, partial [Streptomyces chartreusis]|uniref:VOC family protein n=1 Tax=Streptomyces chartreusis TaxID=1969 RepID=UPI0036CC8128
MKLTAITLDCPDPEALAPFYRQATGLEVHPKSNSDFAGLDGDDGLLIGFQRVDDYRAPCWPDQAVAQQLHLDFAVDDLKGVAQGSELGISLVWLGFYVLSGCGWRRSRG